MTLPPSPPEDTERGIAPVVARSPGGVPLWLMIAAAGIAALVLFGVLDARRRAAQVVSVAPRMIDTVDQPSSLPVLDIPPEPAVPAPVYAPPPQGIPTPAIVSQPPRTLPAPVQAFPPFRVAPSLLLPSTTTVTRPVAIGGSPVVIDTGTAAATTGTARTGTSRATSNGGDAAATERARAGMLANRSTTVPQGTLIHAILETGFDSTRPGFARAIVSRDIMGFDGTRVLIPRGSRLIGEYQADVRPGQKRALIIWTRLIRPDGATIEIGSPAADPVGRGGVKADVDTHFFQRFSGAILQSALNLGVNLASRTASNGVIVALPNTFGSGGNAVIQPTQITPTLRVKPGASISIFVARDLDFTEVENRP